MNDADSGLDDLGIVESQLDWRMYMPSVRPDRAGVLPMLLSLALLQAGCASDPFGDLLGSSGGDDPSLTPAEQRLRQESSLLEGKSALQGCVVGAIGGALIGMLVGGDSNNRRNNNMLAGAAIGCGAGLATNAYVQYQRNQYQNNEQRIMAMTADVRADNEKLASLIATSQEVMAVDERKIGEINAAYRKKSISTSEMRRQIAGIKANRDQLQQTVAVLQKKENHWAEISSMERQSGSDTAGLDAEISRMKSRVTSLQKEVELLDRKINASPAAG
jgi:archaellum component FlaC